MSEIQVVQLAALVQAPFQRPTRLQLQGHEAVGIADAADRTTAIAHGTSITAANHTPTHHTPGQQCPDPTAGDPLPPLRTNRHSDS